MRPRDIPLIERSGLPPHLTTKCSLATRLDPVNQSYKQLSDLCNLKKIVIPLIDVETDSVIQFTCRIQNAGPVKNKENISSNARLSGNHTILRNVSPYQRTIKNHNRLFPRIKIKSHNTGTSYITGTSAGKPYMCNIEAQSNKILKNNEKAEKCDESIKNNITSEPKIVLERLSDDVVKQYETNCTKRSEPVVVLHRLSLDMLKRYNVDTSKWNRRFKSRKVKILQKNKLYFQHLNYQPVLLACEARSHNAHKDQTNRNSLLKAQKPLSNKSILRKQLCRNFGVDNKKKVIYIFHHKIFATN